MTTYDLEQFVNVSRSYSSVRSIVLKLYDIMHMGKYNVEATDSLYYCRWCKSRRDKFSEMFLRKLFKVSNFNSKT